MKLFLIIFSIILIPIQSLAVPFAFEAGKPARASEVNANFNFLNTEIENLQTDHSALDSDVSDLNSDLFTLNLFATGTSNDLSSLSSTVSDLNSEVDTLDDAVIANTQDISLLDSAISAIESAISSIESAITDLDDRVSTLESFEGAEACLSFTLDTSPVGETLTYSYQSATLGQQFMMQGESYTIVKVPVKDIVSGKQYLVTAPFQSNGGGLEVYLVEDKCFGNMNISGYPAQVEFEEYFLVSVNSSDNGLVNTSLSTSFDRLWIKVGNIAIEIRGPYGSYVITNSFDLVASGYDGSAEDLSGVVRNTAFINDIDNFIDYIHIEEVTP